MCRSINFNAMFKYRIFPVVRTIDILGYFLYFYPSITFFEKPISNNLFNFKVIYVLCNTEEILTFNFPLFQGKILVIYGLVVMKLTVNRFFF